MLMSKTKLIPMLRENGFDNPRVGYETFGRKTFAYLYVETMENRFRAQRLLTSKGLNVNYSYAPGQPVVEVQVSYFKAHGWDE